MTTLHLGVIDIPYVVHVPDKKRRVAVRTGRHAGKPVHKVTYTAAPSGGETTGDVAGFLEDKYHVMEFFYEDIGPDLIAKAIEHSAAGVIENIMMGAPAEGLSLTAEAESEVEAAFRHFLDQGEMDNIASGVPTKAALKGVNHRLKHPYSKDNKARPSFIDTGMYQASFKFWVE